MKTIMPSASFMPPLDPHAGYLAHKDEFDKAIQRVLESGRYILDEEVSAFEQEFARYLGVRDAVGVGSGTEALHLSLRACGIGPGHAVITVSHTAVATVAAIELAGSTPVLIDIDPDSYTMDPDLLEETVKRYVSRGKGKQSGRLKAIIPVHLYGHPGDMASVMAIAERYDLMVIEDCAQAHGATIRGKKVGSWGNIGAFSFYPTKNLGAFGDGGAVVTTDRQLADKARLIREYGWRERYISQFSGMNSRLDELQAAVLRVKLRYLDEENKRRRELARGYGTALADTSLNLPRERPDVGHVYHQYVIRSQRRNELRAYLKEHGVDTLIHYPLPVHLQPAYRSRVLIGEGGMARTENTCKEIISLPMYPQLADAQIFGVGRLLSCWNLG